MRKKFFKRLGVNKLIIGIILFIGIAETAKCAGLAVSPGGLLIQEIVPGKLYDLYEISKIGLTIYNKDNKPHTYVLSTHKPSEVGNRKWEKGYLEIPNPQWCWFDKKEIEVEANGKGFVRIYLQIPDEEKYYNQHWVVAIGVIGKTKIGLGVALGIYVRLQIETKSKADIKEKPDGIIAFKPSTVRFKDVSLDNTRESKVVIYNNDDEIHTYRITSLFHIKGVERKNYLTHLYEAIPDTRWISLSKSKVRINPGQFYTLFLKLRIPNDPEYYGRKWEDILLVQPDKGLPGFIRVQIETRKANVD